MPKPHLHASQNPSAIEQIVLLMLRKAKTDPKLAQQLERICPDDFKG